MFHSNIIINIIVITNGNGLYFIDSTTFPFNNSIDALVAPHPGHGI